MFMSKYNFKATKKGSKFLDIFYKKHHNNVENR
jgi:hypothetical protein